MTMTEECRCVDTDRGTALCGAHADQQQQATDVVDFEDVPF